ncbi:hypothetical protein L228DRAFT_150560 [Xylona heveae TC161]|uniref:Uncharacterized protein n=1 Tax=Xylona heveae (strain CBS 132557 / TC161) TaxID=1328760 RepID=A0A165GL69_XYLHT|nr:hypothetical protein L228DRAFT_150560 [Xylona heveae TC161]KZF22324.1 hypothetical protein L228DRAFT_150560 [Xylona heveae TC161]
MQQARNWLLVFVSVGKKWARPDRGDLLMMLLRARSHLSLCLSSPMQHHLLASFLSGLALCKLWSGSYLCFCLLFFYSFLHLTLFSFSLFSIPSSCYQSGCYYSVITLVVIFSLLPFLFFPLLFSSFYFSLLPLGHIL